MSDAKKIEIMTYERAIEELEALAEMSDTEAAHIMADDVLCELLTALGYGDVVEAYANVGKWYA